MHPTWEKKRKEGGRELIHKGLKKKKVKKKNDHLHSFNCVNSKKQKHIQPNTHTHARRHTRTDTHSMQ